MNPNGTALALIDRIRGRALIVGLVGAALGVVGAFVDRAHFDRAYLFSFIFVLGLSLGSMALLLLHRQLGGAWGFLVRRPLESAAMTMPLVAVLFIPVLIDLEHIYPWVNHHSEAENPPGGNPSTATALPTADKPEAKGSPVKVISAANTSGGAGGDTAGSKGVRREPLEKDTTDLMGFKKAWLNPTAFTIRAAIYFALWIVMAAVLSVGSRRQDETKSASLAYGLQAFSAPGLVIYFLSTSLALVDWGMSLEPEWYSSLYGVMLIIGQGISAMAFMIVVAAIIANRGETEGLDTRETFNDLGNLLLAFTMLWGYLSFSQFLIIWSGNLAEEIPWYARRLTGGWQNFGRFLMLFHFAVPFLVLLSRPLKRNVNALWKVGALVLVAHLVNDYWLIAPSFGEEIRSFRPSWLDVVVPTGMIGLWFSAFLWQLRGKPLMVVQDPELPLALKQAAGH